MNNKLYIDINSKLNTYDISSILLKNFGTQKPIIVCVGSDKVLSDMTGVFVAEILKKRNIDAFVFGGTKRTVNTKICKFLAKYINYSNLLFVDSGVLQRDNSILVSPYFLCNDGTKIDALSIIAGTICKNQNKILLASQSYLSIKKYAQIIADSICEFFSYIDFLSLQKNLIK